MSQLPRFKGDPNRIMELARREIGTVERPVNRTEYGEWFGWNGVAWCAIFCSWVFWHAGSPFPPLSTAKGAAYVPAIKDHAIRTGQWRPKGSYTPKVGDLVLFWFTNRPDHIGIVVAVLADGRIWTIEGNTNATGSRTGGMVATLYRRSSIHGFIEIDRPTTNWSELRRWLAGVLYEKIQPLHTMWLNNSTGPADVKVIEQALNLVGNEHTPENGLYEAKTDWAAQRFQKRTNQIMPKAITENLGTFGPQTKMYLAKALANIKDGRA